MRRKFRRDASSICIIGIFYTENVVVYYLGKSNKRMENKWSFLS